MDRKSIVIYKILKPVLFTLFKLLYRPAARKQSYIPARGPIIIIGNHRHMFDPLMIGMSTKRVVNFLAKDDLHKGIVSPFFKAIGTIPIDLNGRNKEASQVIANILLNQEAVGMFPEAKRNYTKDLLLPFKYGAVSLAKKTGAMIVPSGIVGEYRLFRKGPIIIFGAPISIEHLTIDEANEYITEKVREILETNSEIGNG